MRLIDADALKIAIDDGWTPNMMVSKIWGVIDEAPTVEIAKDINVPGKRILHSHNPSYSPFDGSPSVLYRCSNCGYVTGNQTDYCPKCGNKMT